jgi:spore germination protein (amino acid permease)
MVIDRRHDITSKQLMIYIISAQIGTGVINLPSSLAQNVGHDGCITTVLAGIITIPIIIIIMQLLKRYSNKSIYEINNLLYGKYLGKFINLIIFLYFCFATIVNLRVLVEIIQMIVLSDTPPLIVTLLLFAPTLYITFKGLKAICRFSSMLYIVYFLMILSFLLVLKDTRITYLMPFGECGLNGLIKGIPINMYTFLGFELVAIIYPNITDKENAQKYMIFAEIFTTIFYVIIVAFSTAFFGEKQLSMLTMPLYTIEQTIIVPVIERLDIFFLTIWYPAMETFTHACFFSSCYSIIKAFNIKNITITIFSLFTVFLFLSRIPIDFESVIAYTNYTGIFGFGVISLFIISYLFSFINKRGVNSK